MGGEHQRPVHVRNRTRQSPPRDKSRRLTTPTREPRRRDHEVGVDCDHPTVHANLMIDRQRGAAGRPGAGWPGSARRTGRSARAATRPRSGPGRPPAPRRTPAPWPARTVSTTTGLVQLRLLADGGAPARAAVTAAPSSATRPAGTITPSRPSPSPAASRADRGDQLRGEPSGGHRAAPRRYAGLAHRARRPQRRVDRGQHPGGDGHDLGRGAVVDGQLGQPPAVARRTGRAPAPRTRRRPASPVCATSPTSVIDRLGQRRISSRHAIGDSSCASSTMMWPNAQVRSAAARCGGGQPVGLLCRSASRLGVEQVGGGEDLRLGLVLDVERAGAARRSPARPGRTRSARRRRASRRAAAARRPRRAVRPASSSSGTSAGVQPPAGSRSSSARSASVSIGAAAASRSGVGVQVGQQPLRGEHRPQLGPARPAPPASSRSSRRISARSASSAIARFVARRDGVRVGADPLGDLRRPARATISRVEDRRGPGCAAGRTRRARSRAAAHDPGSSRSVSPLDHDLERLVRHPLPVRHRGRPAPRPSPAGP